MSYVLSPIPTISSTPTSRAKHYEKHVDGLTCDDGDDDDDDISLAKCMTRKLQLNQQMYPWMSPDLVALHQQHDSPTTRDSTNANNKYTYTQYQQLQLQLQYQQRLMLQYQHQQQQQQNSVVYDGSSLGQYHHPYHHHQQGTNQQPIMLKPKSPLLSLDHDPKARISPTDFAHRVSDSSPSNTSPSSTNALKIASRRQRNSLLSDSITKNRPSQGGSRQQQHEISPSITPTVKQTIARRSSGHSHTSGSSSSAATTSNMTNISNGRPQVAISRNHSKPPLSKRIRNMIMGKDTDIQIPNASSSLGLQRSSLVTSNTSTKTAERGDGSSMSSWTNLLRKSSRSGSTNYKIEKQTMYGKRSNGQRDVVPDSPASSISGGSYRRSFLQQENYFVDDLPSPESSTSPELPLNHPTDQHHSDNYHDPLQKSESISQLDYFALMTPASQQQHQSMRLRFSSNNQQSSNSLLVTDSDGLPECFLGSSPSNNNIRAPVISAPPVSSESSSVSTSASSLTLDHQHCGNIKPAIKSFSARLNTKIQFATTIQVHDTFGSQDYDRRCDTQVTCQHLTSALALQIKKELNEYKLNEMQVHIQSRQNTQFFL